jgi:hypothetical protein
MLPRVQSGAILAFSGVKANQGSSLDWAVLGAEFKVSAQIRRPFSRLPVTTCAESEAQKRGTNFLTFRWYSGRSGNHIHAQPPNTVLSCSQLYPLVHP